MKNVVLLGAHFAAVYAAVHFLHPEHRDGPVPGIDPMGPAKIAAVAIGLHVLTNALAGKVAGR